MTKIKVFEPIPPVSNLLNQKKYNTTTRFTAATSPDNIALLEAVAAYLDTSRARLVTGILDDAMIPLIMSIPEADRLEILKKSGTHLGYQKSWKIGHRRPCLLMSTLSNKSVMWDFRSVFVHWVVQGSAVGSAE